MSVAEFAGIQSHRACVHYILHAAICVNACHCMSNTAHSQLNESQDKLIFNLQFQLAWPFLLNIHA